MKNLETDRTVRGSRRKRVAAVAGVAAALLAIGGGTALAVGATGAAAAKTTAAPVTAATTGSSDDTTVLLGFPDGGSVRIPLAGYDVTMARALLVGKAHLQTSFVKAACDGKPGSVIAVSPHAPTVVHKGDTVTVTLCAG
ncbi:PASTA domain-containing protein [Streptomyces sp. NRRL S-813]|uniref:PASTA domain-containing protein n=1 Tax=Streptomyces sp. NRRL S-813 TaxID=1463919 RepID=UPI0007C6DEC1|nr:PASTA domain-containing protein [Streptomyces sp. NRRL S-813]